jgi:hypothetical protein
MNLQWIQENQEKSKRLLGNSREFTGVQVIFRDSREF